MAGDIVDMVWDTMKKEIADLNARVTQVENVTEQAGYADGIPAYAFASLPTQGLANGQNFVTLAWVFNAVKPGESTGAGTGVLAIYQASSGTWKRIGDYVDVSI